MFKRLTAFFFGAEEYYTLSIDKQKTTLYTTEQRLNASYADFPRTLGLKLPQKQPTDTSEKTVEGMVGTLLVALRHYAQFTGPPNNRPIQVRRGHIATLIAILIFVLFCFFAPHYWIPGIICALLGGLLTFYILASSSPPISKINELSSTEHNALTQNPYIKHVRNIKVYLPYRDALNDPNYTQHPRILGLLRSLALYFNQSGILPKQGPEYFWGLIGAKSSYQKMSSCLGYPKTLQTKQYTFTFPTTDAKEKRLKITYRDTEALAYMKLEKSNSTPYQTPYQVHSTIYCHPLQPDKQGELHPNVERDTEHGSFSLTLPDKLWRAIQSEQLKSNTDVGFTLESSNRPKDPSKYNWDVTVVPF